MCTRQCDFYTFSQPKKPGVLLYTDLSRMAETKSTRSRIWIWIVPLLILLAASLYFLLPGTRDRVVVETAKVERDDLAKTFTTNGKVEPLADFQAHAPTASTVEDLEVHLGQQVAQGQLLLKLDATDAQLRIANAQNALTAHNQDLRNLQSGGTQDELLTERSNLSSAETQLKDASVSLGSLQTLQARGASSSNEVAAAQARVADAQAHVTQLRSRLGGRYGAGDYAVSRSQLTRDRQELLTAQSGLAGMNVHSPFAGTIYSLTVARYDYVSPGQAMLSVADLHKLQVRAFFDEPEIGNLAAGEPVKIVWDAKLDHTWHGHVTQAPTTVINVGTRNVGECLISVEDAQGDLLPNTNVTVTVTTLQRRDVLSLPREALHTEGTRNYVFRIVEGKLVRTPVSVGLSNLVRFEVRSGLQYGEVVAVRSPSDVELQSGLPVRTQP